MVRTPERSSVAENCTVRVAEPVAVLIVGAKLNAVNTGAVTSCTWDDDGDGSIKAIADAKTSTAFER
jgi:hypothetical protein